MEDQEAGPLIDAPGHLMLSKLMVPASPLRSELATRDAPSRTT